MNLLKRSIVAVIAIPVLLWLYYTGGVYLISFLALLTFLVSYELVKMFKNKNINLLYFNTVSSVLLFFSIVYNHKHTIFILFFVILFNSIQNVFRGKIDGAIQRISSAVLTVTYPAIGFAYFYKLSDFNPLLVIVLACLIWITDIFAYFSGMLLGKHKNIFVCSPNKSLEGFIGGFIFATIGALAARYIDASLNSFKFVILLSISAGIFGQFGDLLESIIKRDLGVKDSSGIIPGHGGVLDRFDSLLIAAPILYIFIEIF